MEAEKESTFLCRVCDEPAELFCPSCKKYYCGECSAVVHKKRLKRGHKPEVVKKDVRESSLKRSGSKSPCPEGKAAPRDGRHMCKKLEFFCLDDNEVFCRSCFDQKHKGHPVIRLEEALRNFSIEKYIKAFNEAFNMTKGLLEHINDEVDLLQDNVTQARAAISSSFDRLRAALDEEELALLNQLEAEAVSTEQQLTEVFQSATEQVEKSQPLIDKYILRQPDDCSNTDDDDDDDDDDADNDDECCHIRNNGACGRQSGSHDGSNAVVVKSGEISEMLVTVQNMEQSIEEMRSLQLIPLTRLSAKYDESTRKIEFERFAFSGLQVPREISFSEVGSTSVRVGWRVCNPVGALKDGIRYCLEMKTEAPNGKRDYVVVYEGPEYSCQVEKLVRGWTYTFRVCCVLDKCRGEWSVENSIRTRNIKLESVILSQENPMFPVHISEWCRAKHFELLYRASRDGMKAADFHRKCDGEGPTVTIVKSANGCIFGGYASISWGTDNKGHKAPRSFLFTLKNVHELQPARFPLKDKADSNAVFHYSNCGAAFGKGADLIIYSPFNSSWKSHTGFSTYQDLSGKGYSILSGERSFVASDVEVFKVILRQRN